MKDIRNKFKWYSAAWRLDLKVVTCDFEVCFKTRWLQKYKFSQIVKHLKTLKMHLKSFLRLLIKFATASNGKTIPHGACKYVAVAALRPLYLSLAHIKAAFTLHNLLKALKHTCRNLPYQSLTVFRLQIVLQSEHC